MEKLIIWIVLLVFFYLMNRISTWKKRAATAFLVVGQRATTKEERKWGYRNALRAGEQAEQTLNEVKAAMKINYFDDAELIKHQAEKYNGQ